MPSKLPLNKVLLQDAKVAYDTIYEVIVAVLSWLKNEALLHRKLIKSLF